jgi:hypothetical protein
MASRFEKMEESSGKLLEEQKRKSEKAIQEDEKLSEDVFFKLANCA